MSHSEAYTSLRVTEAGVVLFAQHLRRLSLAGGQARAELLSFARTAAPGVYSIRAGEAGISVQPRGPSSLIDGIPTRVIASPYSDRSAAFAKPAPPSRYEGVRIPGLATLLASPDGGELYESCTAALLAWDGAHLLAAPRDRPGVRSVAIDALEEAGWVRFQPILAHSDLPLALVNAVAGIKLPSLAGRAPFPPGQRERVAALFAASARRE